MLNLDPRAAKPGVSLVQTPEGPATAIWTYVVALDPGVLESMAENIADRVLAKMDAREAALKTKRENEALQALP